MTIKTTRLCGADIGQVLHAEAARPTSAALLHLAQMVQLGEVLEVIHSSRHRFRTARASGTTNGSGWRLWWAGDDHFRYEHAGGSVQVRAGPVWWLVDRDGEAHTNEGDPASRLSMQSEFRLLHTRNLLSEAILEVIREDHVLGRRAAVIRAEPRSDRAHGRWWGFWKDLESIELPIDLERGVVLGGLGITLEEIAFDEDFSTEVFARPYPEGQRAKRSLQVPVEVTMEDAMGAPFAVSYPRWLPEGARLIKCMMDETQPPQWVGFSWAIDPGYLHHLHIRQGPALSDDAQQTGGEEILEGNLRIRVVRTEMGPSQLNDILVAVDDDWIEIHSDLPVETLLQVARSLARTGD
jgi:hypothetical protein